MNPMQGNLWQRVIVIGAVVCVASIASLRPVGANELEEEAHDLSASPTVIPQPIMAPPVLNLAQFRSNQCNDNQPGVSNRTINLRGTTIPSLWWTQDLLQAKPQFNPKLIEGWLVCGAAVQNPNARVCGVSLSRSAENGESPQKLVKMLVNPQLWTLLDYVDRYEFLYRFGTATSECGYNIYIFNTEAVLLADYTCDFGAVGEKDNCVLRPDLSGKSGLKRSPANGFSATEYRIDVF